MPKLRVIFLTLFILTVEIPVLVYAGDADGQYYNKIKNLRIEWKVFSAKENALVPYLESIDSRVKNIYISLDPEEYRKNGLLLDLNKRSALFINNQLAYRAESKGMKIFQIDSLASIYGRNKFLLSIYTPMGVHDLETDIVSYSNKNPAYLNRIDHIPIFIRESGTVWDFMRLGVIVILVLYVILINIGGRVFKDYYNIINSFLRAGADEFLNRSRNITRIDLIYIVVLSLVLSFFIIIILDTINIGSGTEHINAISQFLGKWLWLAAIILLWIMLRFFIISLSSDLFKMKAIGTIHAFEYLRITNFYSLMIFLLLVLLLFVIHLNLVIFSNMILYSMIVLGILRAIMLYIKFLNSSDYTKLYLFSYLCCAELLPVIIGLRILLKSDLLHVIV